MRKVSVALLALIVGGGTAVAVTTSQAGASSEFSLVSHVTNVEFATEAGAALVPSQALAPGDRLLIRSDLAENGINAGYSNIVCTVTFNDNVLCDGVFALANRGDLHATALIRGAAGPKGIPTTQDFIVDGGTFEFRDAHGSAHVVVSPNGDETFMFALG
jgi:hypothetical protein